MPLFTGLFHHNYHLSITLTSMFSNSKEVGKHTFYVMMMATGILVFMSVHEYQTLDSFWEKW